MPATLKTTSKSSPPAATKPITPPDGSNRSAGAPKESSTNFPPVIHQVHERIIGGRKLANKTRSSVSTSPGSRSSSGAKAEPKSNSETTSGGETREGLIIHYVLEKEKTSDAKQIQPAIDPLVSARKLPVGNAWGDRGPSSLANEEFPKTHHIRSGPCPRNVARPATRLESEPGMREGLRRRAGIEARVSIIIREFMGKPARAKGFAHRETMVGRAVLSYNLWVLSPVWSRQPRRQGWSK